MLAFMPAQLRLIKPDEPRAAYRADALPLFLAALTCGAAAAAFTELGYRGRLAPVVAGPCAAAFALWCASLALSFAERRAQRFVLTARRLEIERGILSRRVERIELWRVRDVQLHRGPFEKVRGAGRLTLFVARASAEATVTLGPVANARSLYEALLAATVSQRTAATPSAEPVRDRR